MTRSRLETRRRKLTQQAPDLAQLVRGSLFERTRRCGRPTCHCADGPGHATAGSFPVRSIAAGVEERGQVLYCDIPDRILFPVP